MVSEYKMKSTSGHVKLFTLVIITNPKPNLIDQYIVFATNIASDNIFLNLSQIPEEYKKRMRNKNRLCMIEKLKLPLVQIIL